MIAGQKDFRNCFSLKDPGAGVVGVFQQPLFVGLFDLGFRTPQHLGLQTNHRIQQDQGRRLSAAEDVISDRKLIVAVKGADAFIDPFIAAANQGQAPFLSKTPDQLLIQWPAPRSQQHHMGRTGGTLPEKI
jgi:hypothetical protein